MPWLSPLRQRGAAANHVERDGFRSYRLCQHCQPEGGGELLGFARIHVMAEQVKPSVKGNIEALVGWEGGQQYPFAGDQFGVVVVEE